MEENSIWILFANGTGSRVQLSLHHGGDDKTRPADAYVVTGGGLSRSARRAAEAVYNCLQQAGRNPDRFVAGFDVQNADGTMNGESAGLSFAIALAARILNRHGFVVAATGEISGGQYPGPVAAVEAINEKLAAASSLLPSGSVFVYPAANDDAIESRLRDLLEVKGIRLLPVDSVSQALEFIIGEGLGTQARPIVPFLPQRRGLLIAGMVAGILMIVGFFWWMSREMTLTPALMVKPTTFQEVKSGPIDTKQTDNPETSPLPAGPQKKDNHGFD